MANKGCKGQTKGQRAKNVKILGFLVVLGLIGVNNAVILLVLSLKTIQAQKAASVAGNAKLQMHKVIDPKTLS